MALNKNILRVGERKENVVSISIRRATNNDSTAIKALVFSVLREYGLEPDPESTDKDLSNIEVEYFSNGGYFGVVEVDKGIVASVGLYRVSDSTCEIRKMYCLPSCRGKGIGKMLLEHAIGLAKESGYKRIVLETATPLKEAVGLYKSYGFVQYTPEHLAARCDQAYELYI